MGALVRLLLVLALIVLVMAGATAARGPDGVVTLAWGDLSVETSVPVVLGLLTALLVVAYYLGQLVYWLGGLPSMIRALRGQRKRQATMDKLVAVLVAQRLGKTREAGRLMQAVMPQADEEDLVTVVKLLLDRVAGPEALELQGHETYGALASLSLAHKAADAQDWAGVRDHSRRGLEQAPDSPRLLLLHMKALLNLGESASARALLPQLKGQIEPQAYALLGEVIDAETSPEKGVALTQKPWVVAFRTWLGTAAEEMPAVPGQGHGAR